MENMSNEERCAHLEKQIASARREVESAETQWEASMAFPAIHNCSETDMHYLRWHMSELEKLEEELKLLLA